MEKVTEPLGKDDNKKPNLQIPGTVVLNVIKTNAEK